MLAINNLKKTAIGLAAAALLSGSAQAAEDTIKVGVLHSLSGTMAISETTLKDTVLMLVEEQNKKGGYWARSWRRLWLIRHQTGRYSLRKHVN